LLIDNILIEIKRAKRENNNLAKKNAFMTSKVLPYQETLVQATQASMYRNFEEDLVIGNDFLKGKKEAFIDDSLSNSV
jgi:hypothetical protein